jgi:cullin 4
MQADLTKYANYYKQRHSGHVLDWDHALGTVTMTGQFNIASKELSVSLYQAIVLLLFNGPSEWRYLDIKEQTRMGKHHLSSSRVGGFMY